MIHQNQKEKENDPAPNQKLTQSPSNTQSRLEQNENNSSQQVQLKRNAMHESRDVGILKRIPVVLTTSVLAPNAELH